MRLRKTGDEAVDRGRLFRLQLLRSKAARDDALATIRELPSGWWQVRIGGRMRGRTVRVNKRQYAVDMVNEHYNAKLFETITRKK